MQLTLGADPQAARAELEAERARRQDTGFICDVLLNEPDAPDAAHCMDVQGHPLEGRHVFGTSSFGLHERVWGDSLLSAAGRCDLAPREHGYALVPNHLVRRYPLDPESGQVIEIAFAGFYGDLCVPCPTCHVEVGRHCRRPSGHSGPLVRHPRRGRLAGRVRLVGLSCAKCGALDGPESYVAPVLPCPEAEAAGVVGAVWCQRCADAFQPPQAEGKDAPVVALADVDSEEEPPLDAEEE